MGRWPARQLGQAEESARENRLEARLAAAGANRDVIGRMRRDRRSGYTGGSGRRDALLRLPLALVIEARDLQALLERQRRIFRRRPAIGSLSVAAEARYIEA